MASRTVLSDDLDGREPARTYRFGFDGRRYEIDLTPDNYARLCDILAPALAVARKIRPDGAPERPRVRTTADRERSAEIRAWAQRKNIDVPERGRIPAAVVKRYEAAQEAGRRMRAAKQARHG